MVLPSERQSPSDPLARRPRQVIEVFPDPFPVGLHAINLHKVALLIHQQRDRTSGGAPTRKHILNHRVQQPDRSRRRTINLGPGVAIH